MGRGIGFDDADDSYEASLSEAERQQMRALDIAPQAEVDRLVREGTPICGFCRHGAANLIVYKVQYDSESEVIPSVGYVCDRCSSVEEMEKRSPGAQFTDVKVKPISEARLQWLREAAAIAYSDEPDAYERYQRWLDENPPAE